METENTSPQLKSLVAGSIILRPDGNHLQVLSISLQRRMGNRGKAHWAPMLWVREHLTGDQRNFDPKELLTP
jgi:hypothetical protein